MFEIIWNLPTWHTYEDIRKRHFVFIIFYYIQFPANDSRNIAFTSPPTKYLHILHSSLNNWRLFSLPRDKRSLKNVIYLKAFSVLKTFQLSAMFTRVQQFYIWFRCPSEGVCSVGVSSKSCVRNSIYLKWTLKVYVSADEILKSEVRGLKIGN